MVQSTKAAGHPVGVDHLSTTAVVAYVRRRITPAMLWSAIGALVTALVVSITWLVTTQHDISQLKDSTMESKKSVADMQGRLDILQDIKTEIAVIGSRLDTIADEVDRQREWRDHVQGVAEAPPHPRRKH